MTKIIACIRLLGSGSSEKAIERQSKYARPVLAMLFVRLFFSRAPRANSCLKNWCCDGNGHSSEERLKFQQALLTLPPVQMMILVCCASEVCFSLSEVSKCHPCGTVAGSILLMTNIFHLAQGNEMK